MKKLSLRINKPSAAELASIGSLSSGVESQSRYGGFGINPRAPETSRDRRLDFSRSRPSYFSPSQQSQQSNFSQSQQTTDLPSLPGRSSEDVEQRLAALESLVSGVSDSIASMRKELESQSSMFSVMLKEQEGIKRLLEAQQKATGSVRKDMEKQHTNMLKEHAGMKRLLETGITENIKSMRKDLENQTEKFSLMLKEQEGNMHRMFETLQAKVKLAFEPEVIRVESSDDETVSKMESDEDKTDETMNCEDIYAASDSEDELIKMREKVRSARRNVKRRR